MTKILILFVIIIIISGEIICEYQLIEKFNNINPNTLINLNKFYSNTKSISLECKQLKNETLLQYTHGKRITGDQLIAHSTIDKQFLNSIQDKVIILTYEQNNTGPILSYLKIIVDQVNIYILNCIYILELNFNYFSIFL